MNSSTTSSISVDSLTFITQITNKNMKRTDLDSTINDIDEDFCSGQEWYPINTISIANTTKISTTTTTNFKSSELDEVEWSNLINVLKKLNYKVE